MAFLVKSVCIFPNPLLPALAAAPWPRCVQDPHWILIHQCPPGGLPETPRAVQSFCCSTDFHVGSFSQTPDLGREGRSCPACDKTRGFLAGKAPGGSPFLLHGSPKVGNQIGAQSCHLDHKDLGSCFVLTSKIPWRRNPGLLKQKHSLFL